MLNKNVHATVHNPKTPFFFRNFVEALFRLFYIRCKYNLLQATKSLEAAVTNHLVPMMQNKKAPKPIISDEAVFEESLAQMASEIDTFEHGFTQVRKVLRRPGQYLTLADFFKFVEVGYLDSRGWDSM